MTVLLNAHACTWRKGTHKSDKDDNQMKQNIMLTTASVLSILKTGKARAIRFSTLEAICEVLECQPGDLLEFEPAAGP